MYISVLTHLIKTKIYSLVEFRDSQSKFPSLKLP